MTCNQKRNTFEKTLPDQYCELVHITSDQVTGFWRDLETILPGLVLTAIGWILVRPTIAQALISFAVFAASVYPYFILHELAHAIVIMAMTKQRVEIGFHKSGMYCSISDVYLYQNVAAKCTAAPLEVFSALFGLAAIIMIVFKQWLFLPFTLLTMLNLFGCRADITLMQALQKYRSESLLVRDTGNEQWLYDIH